MDWHVAESIDDGEEPEKAMKKHKKKHHSDSDDEKKQESDEEDIEKVKYKKHRSTHGNKLAKPEEVQPKVVAAHHPIS